MQFDRLQVVFKVVERCNINCDYCYYFNMGDQSAMHRPPVVSVEAAARMADWLAEGCADMGIGHLSIAFHGGEPMMLKPRNFDAICQAFRDRLDAQVSLSFGMQTNGTIMSDTWLEILTRHKVHVGLSIDGGRAEHDRHRLDHKGRSTFDKTMQNTRRLKAHATGDARGLGPSTISVLDSKNDYRAVFDFLNGLDVRRMSFLLPDRSHDLPFFGGKDSARAYGQALYDIFAAWLENDDPGIQIRFVSEFLSHLQLSPEQTDDIAPTFVKVHGPQPRKTQVIIMHSDGKVGVNDSYIPALQWFEKTPEYDIETSTLRRFLSDPIFAEIAELIETRPTGCRACRWQEVCRGGDLENRFSSKTGFDNPSIYCEGLTYFYEQASALLVRNGYPADYVEMALAS